MDAEFSVPPIETMDGQWYYDIRILFSVALNERLALLLQELIFMRTKSRWFRFLTVLGLGLLVALLAFPANSLAVNLLSNGGFQLFQLYMEGSQART